MPEDFLTSLDADVAAIADVAHNQSTARDRHVAAHAGIKQSTKQGMDIVRALDAIVRNQIGKEPVGLAKWRSARHIERHHPTDVATPPTPAPSKTSEAAQSV